MTVSRGGRKIPPKDNSKNQYVSKEEFELQQKRTLESIEKIKEELIKNNRQVDTLNEQIRPLNSILKKIEMILDQLNNSMSSTDKFTNSKFMIIFSILFTIIIIFIFI